MMNAKKIRNAMVACLALLVGFTGTAMAQGAGGGGGGGGGRPGRGNWNPEEMRARYEQMMKEQLGVSDEDWQVLGPLVNTVSEKRRSMGGMRMGGFRRRNNEGGPQGGPQGGPRGGQQGGPEGGPQAGPQGGPQGGPEGGPQGGPEGQPPRMGGEQDPAAEALAQALDDPETSAADIQAKLEAYRKSQVAKEAELKEAREKLRAAVTARQEARLVLMGILD